MVTFNAMDTKISLIINLAGNAASKNSKLRKYNPAKNILTDGSLDLLNSYPECQWKVFMLLRVILNRVRVNQLINQTDEISTLRDCYFDDKGKMFKL